MKKVILMLMLFALPGAGSLWAQKVGHVDFQELMLGLPERKTAEDSLKKVAAGFEEELKRMEMKYQTLVNEFNADDKAGKMPAGIKESRYAEIMDYQGRIQKFEEYAQENLGNVESQLLEPMMKKVRDAVGKVAKAQGVNYVLDKSQLIFIDGGTDLQPLVKKELGII